MPNENVTLVAHFVEETVETFMLTLIANPSNGGTVAGGGQFSQGEVITIAASPAEGFVFVGWTGNVAESMEAITSFTMPAEDATLTANFEVEQPEKYNVTFLVADNGGNSVENASVNITGVSETFTTNNQGIATAQLENGQYDYNITANNFEVSSGNFTVNGADINVDVTLTSVGLEDDILSNIEVYPNPFSNSISLKNADKANRVVITNLIGQVLLDVKLNGSERETIKVEGLAVGVYLMNIYSENGDKVVYKMIKE